MSACLKSASVSVLVYGSPSREFSMERGLRQGYHLSPLVFLIVAKGLHVLTKRYFLRIGIEKISLRIYLRRCIAARLVKRVTNIVQAVQHHA